MNETEALPRQLMALELQAQPKTSQYHYHYSPEKRYGGEEYSRPKFAHDDCRRHLEKNIGNKENEKDNGLWRSILSVSTVRFTHIATALAQV